MSTHRRAWFIRAGVVVVMAGASLFGLAAPALAASDPKLFDYSLSPQTINAGQETTVNFTVKMSDGMQGTADVSVSSNNNKVTCSSTCQFGGQTIPAATGKTYAVKMKATGNFTGDEQATINIQAGSDSKQLLLTVHANQQQQQPTVPEVSGTVTDVFSGTPIENAQVSIQDSATPTAHTYSTGTDKSGNFKFIGSATAPIVAGVIAFAVDKSGLQPFPGLTKTANAGQPLAGVALKVALLATAGPTTQAQVPSNTPENTTLPADSGRPDIVSGQDSGGGLSWVLIAIGGVLVLLGIGAIVLLLVRRNGAGGDDENDDGRGGPRGPGGRGGQGGGPGGRGGGRGGPGGGPGGPRRGPDGPPRGGGGYDPTRPMRSPVSPGPRAEQTVIAPSPLAGGGPRGGGRGPGPGPNGYGQPGGNYGGPQGQYGQQAPPAGEYPGGYDPYGQQPGYGPNPSSGGPRPGPGQQPDGRRVDWLDD